MPKKRMWTEVIMDFWVEKFPIQKSEGFWWFAKMFCFLFVIWFSGLLSYAFDGIVIRYLYNLEVHALLFGIGIIAFWGSSGLRSFLEWLPEWGRPILKLGKTEFEKFFEKGERLACSFFPPLLLALVWTFFLTTNFYFFLQDITVHSAWLFAFSFFIWLLIGTGIWIIVSQWLLIFRVSRQPLNLQLSPRTSKTFRPFAIQTLYGAAGFFLGMAIFLFFYPPAVFPYLEFYCFFIIFGALAFIIPFYNIHLVLLRLKKQELNKIDEETNELLKELKNTLAEHPTQNSRDHITTITARLLALHIKEKSVREAEDWPVGISFFSTLAAIVLIPLIIEFFTRIFLS